MVKISTPDTTRSYNPCGQPLNISSGGSTLAYTYDATDQVTGATYGSGQSDSYAYDAMGNRTSATLARNPGATTAYTSNAANQYTVLTGSAAPTYDPNGNLLTANGVTYTWDSQHD